MIEIKKKRAIVEKIVKDGLLWTIGDGVKSSGGRGEKWCQCQDGAEYIDDILLSWIEDEGGDQAIDRLVNLIIY